MRILIDSTFWILFTVIGLNVVTSLILDGFRQLKAERERSVKDMTTLCTICGLSKDHLTSKGISWEQHTEREHNIWSYITFFYYLQEHRGRFSAVENQVLHKFKNADPSFLPLGRCISLDTPIKRDEWALWCSKLCDLTKRSWRFKVNNDIEWQHFLEMEYENRRVSMYYIPCNSIKNEL